MVCDQCLSQRNLEQSWSRLAAITSPSWCATAAAPLLLPREILEAEQFIFNFQTLVR